MEKPKSRVSAPVYDLIEVLDYIEYFVPSFKKKIWKELCNLGYINNDTTTGIYWEGLLDDGKEDISDGINLMFTEFPDIKEGKVNFQISW